MTTTTARLHFHLPYAFARGYLDEGLTRVTQSGPQRLTLGAHLPATPFEFSKTVLVEFLPPSGKTGEAWTIRWVPETGGIFPSFEGTLDLRKDENDGSTIMELVGTYTPPLGDAGKVFDRVLGHKLTEDTAHRILADLAAEMDAHYELEKARTIFRNTPAS